MFFPDDGRSQVFYTEKGFYADPPPYSQFQYPYIALQDLGNLPVGTRSRYIPDLPERFANGDPNDPLR